MGFIDCSERLQQPRIAEAINLSSCPVAWLSRAKGELTKMTTLETIPDEEGAMLLNKPKSTGIRRLAAAAALASFVIGVLAATAVRTSPGRLASTNLSTVTVSVQIEDAETHKMCMTVQGDESKKNAGLVLYERCTGASAGVRVRCEERQQRVQTRAVGDGGISITTSKKAESDGGFCYKKN